jgi:hypothetical protein
MMIIAVYMSSHKHPNNKSDRQRLRDLAGHSHHKINRSHRNAVIDISGLPGCGAASHPRRTDTSSTLLKPQISFLIYLQKIYERVIVSNYPALSLNE